MDIPNRTRLRVAALVGFTALVGLVGSTTAGAVAGSGGAVIEGAGAHRTIVVPADVWQSKCDFLVAKAAGVAAAQQAAELKAEKLAAAHAAKLKAEKLKAAKLAKLKAAHAAADPAHTWAHHHHGWKDAEGAAGDPGTGCSGHDKDVTGDADSSKG